MWELQYLPRVRYFSCVVSHDICSDTSDRYRFHRMRFGVICFTDEMRNVCLLISLWKRQKHAKAACVWKQFFEHLHSVTVWVSLHWWSDRLTALRSGGAQAKYTKAQSTTATSITATPVTATPEKSAAWLISWVSCMARSLTNKARAHDTLMKHKVEWIVCRFVVLAKKSQNKNEHETSATGMHLHLYDCMFCFVHAFILWHVCKYKHDYKHAGTWRFAYVGQTRKIAHMHSYDVILEIICIFVCVCTYDYVCNACI